MSGLDTLYQMVFKWAIFQTVPPLLFGLAIQYSFSNNFSQIQFISCEWKTNVQTLRATELANAHSSQYNNECIYYRVWERDIENVEERKKIVKN